LLFQTPHLSLIHSQAAWYAEVSSEIEQIVLYIFQAAAQDFFKILCKQQADTATQFIHGTHGLYAQAFLSAPAAVSQTRGAVVSRAGVDSGKTVSHTFLFYVPEIGPGIGLRCVIVTYPCRT
jgi:hypothetical protein